MSVQDFVFGVYLSVRSMLASTASLSRPTVNLLNRYLRLVVPFFFALVLAILCAFAARRLFVDTFIPEALKLLRILPHVSLLHGEMDFEVLTTDASFIANYFQLFMMMLVIAWLGNKTIDTRKNFLVRLSYAGGGANTILIQP